MSFETVKSLAGVGLLHALGKSWRLHWHGLERLERARQSSPQGNVLFAFYHASLLTLAYTHRHRDAQILVSQHRDGEWIARIIARMGYGLVRGSNKRGGLEALFRLGKLLESGKDVGITVDGPIGPRYSVQPGIVHLAKRSGCPIVPVIPTAARCHFLPTWDAQRLPGFGTDVHVQHGEILRLDAAVPIGEAQRHLEQILAQWTCSEEEDRHARRIEMRDIQDRRGWFERVSETPEPPLALRLLAKTHGALRHLRGAPRLGSGKRPWVVGVGNLEAGGTGKTPCVLWLAQRLSAAGLRCGVLTRGYGGRLGRDHPETVRTGNLDRASDEARLYREVLPPQVEVIVSRRKAETVRHWTRQEPMDVLLVDDAFQTIGLPVDRHLVLLDWEHPFGNGYLMPAGRLRQPGSALKRAHVLLFTRAQDETLPRHAAWSHLPVSRCFLAREENPGITDLQGRLIDVARLRGRSVASLCGLGRPRAFEETVLRLGARYGFELRRSVRVSDHGDLEPALAKLNGQLRRLGCDYILVSRKDRCRLDPQQRDEPLLVVEQRLVIPKASELLSLLVPNQSSAKSATFTGTDANT